MDTEATKYEIAYIISPKVTEDDVVRVSGIITRIIEDLRGVVRHVHEPIKRRLAYFIENDKNAYFGYTTFTIAQEAVKEISKKLLFEKEVLRFLIVEEEVDLAKRTGFRPSWYSTEGMPGAKVEAPKREAEVSTATPEEKEAEMAKLDKRLDEILGS